MSIYIFSISAGLTFAFVLHKLVEDKFSKTFFLTKIIRLADDKVVSFEDSVKGKFKNSYLSFKKFIFRTGPKMGLEAGESFLVFLENFGRNMSTRIRGAKELVREEGNGRNFIKAVVKGEGSKKTLPETEDETPEESQEALS